MSKNAGIGITVGLLAIAILITIWTGGGGAAGGGQYYYDLQTGELVAHDTPEAPPITLPSGNRGVQARVFACGDCASNESFVGFLVKYSDEDKQAMNTAVNQEDVRGPIDVPLPLIARKPEAAGDEPQWVTMRSPEGMAIERSAREQCGATPPKECTP